MSRLQHFGVQNQSHQALLPKLNGVKVLRNLRGFKIHKMLGSFKFFKTNLFTNVFVHSLSQIFKWRTEVRVKIPAPFHHIMPEIKQWYSIVNYVFWTMRRIARCFFYRNPFNENNGLGSFWVIKHIWTISLALTSSKYVDMH